MPAGKLSTHIYATTYPNNTLTEFTLAGTVVRTITINLDVPQGVAVDSKGKIYVANYSGNTITTYTLKGATSKPTITGLTGVTGVAVH